MIQAEAARTGERGGGTDHAVRQRGLPSAVGDPGALAPVGGDDGVRHDADDRSAGEGGEQAGGQQQAAAELTEAGEEGHEPAGLVADGFDAVAAEPAEQLLGAVSGEQHTDDDPDDQECDVHGRGFLSGS